MSIASFVEETLLPADRRDDRQAQLFTYLCLAATAAALVAAAMTGFYGYGQLALLIFLAAATIPVALLILRYSHNALVAGHYLAANLMLQSMLFAADPEVSCVVLIALAAGVALLGPIGSKFWLAVILTRCIWVAVNAGEETASATAAVAALVCAVVFMIVQLSEQSRVRSLQRATANAQQSSRGLNVMESIVANYFDTVLQVSGNDIYFATPGVTKLLGYDPQRLIDRPLDYYLHPEEVGLLGTLEPGEDPLRAELRMRHANGRWVWVEAYAAPDVMRGNPNRTLLVLRNYEKERKVSDQLTQAQRLESMGSMAAAVAHDFNNMLTVILGIADELPEGSARQEISRVAGNAAALTNKLLTFGHGQRTSTDIHDLSDILRERSLLLQHGLDSRYIIIESYSEEPLLVRIEEAQFEQVLVNLVNNAREAMPDGGELEVSLQSVELDGNNTSDHEGVFAVLEVRDSGSGIDSDTQARVFDPFFSTKTNTANSGLGLSSCYGIAAQYGGFIEIDSQPGSGTAVRVFLPIAETRDHEPMLELIDNETYVLIIDDDPGIVRVIRNALTRAGYHARGFTDPSAALEFFDPNKVALVIADVVMPSVSGADLIRRLRRRAPDLPVLFISGFTDQELDDWKPDDTTTYLAKPFRSEEIVSRVDSLLSSSRTGAEMFG